MLVCTMDKDFGKKTEIDEGAYEFLFSEKRSVSSKTSDQYEQRLQDAGTVLRFYHLLVTILSFSV